MGELSPQVTERARTLAGGAPKAPPSGELAANTVSRLRGLSRPIGEGGIAAGDDGRGTHAKAPLPSTESGAFFNLFLSEC